MVPAHVTDRALSIGAKRWLWQMDGEVTKQAVSRVTKGTDRLDCTFVLSNRDELKCELLQYSSSR